MCLHRSLDRIEEGGQIMASLAIATAAKQYVFRRNYSTRKWENIAGDGKTCRIQVLKKGSTGDYILKIFPEVGEVTFP